MLASIRAPLQPAALIEIPIVAVVVPVTTTTRVADPVTHDGSSVPQLLMPLSAPSKSTSTLKPLKFSGLVGRYGPPPMYCQSQLGAPPPKLVNVLHGSYGSQPSRCVV